MSNNAPREATASTRDDRVSEQPVGGLQCRDNGTAKGILTGQMAAEQPSLTVAVWRENAHDDHVGVEGAHLFHTDQLEPERPARKLFNGSQGRFGCQANVSQRAGNPFGPSDDRVSWLILELHLCRTLRRVRPHEGKAREAKSFTTRAMCRGAVVESVQAERKV